MKTVLSIFESGEIEDLKYTKHLIKYFMRGITDYCANNNQTYKREKRTQLVFKYSVDAWKLKDEKRQSKPCWRPCNPIGSDFSGVHENKTKHWEEMWSSFERIS